MYNTISRDYNKVFNLSGCVNYLEWSAHRDHHLNTSCNQLVNSEGHLIVPPVDLIPPWLQPQAVIFSGEEQSDHPEILLKIID